MQRYRPALETLERRDTPAGTVTGSFANGTWTLVGDADANDIVISSTLSDAFSVSGRNGTVVAGVTDPGGVRNIVIKLGAGDDVVEVKNGGLWAFLPGSLKIDGGDGGNAVAIDGLQIGKSLSIRNGNGLDEVALRNSRVAGHVVIRNGSGGSSVEIKRDTLDHGSAIGGNLRITNDAGADNTALQDTHIGGNVVVRNGLPDAGGNAGSFFSLNGLNETTQSIFGGNVSVRYLGGDSANGILDVEVLGNVKFDHGNGGAEVYFEGINVLLPVHIHGNLTVIGQGGIYVEVGQNFAETGLIVDRNLTIRTGGEADGIEACRLQVGGATRIHTGGGADTIFIDDSTFAGPVDIQTGDGVDNVQVESKMGTSSRTQFVGALKVHLGAGRDTIGLGVHADETRMVEALSLAHLHGGADLAEFTSFHLLSVFDLFSFESFVE